MKRRIVSTGIAMLFLAVVTHAQSGATTFGLRAGVNFQNITGSGQDNKLRTGFNIGGNVEIPIAQDFYVQPGLLFSTKGANAKNSSAHISTSYLEVPVNLLYKPSLGDGKLLLGFGPYLGVGVGGKVKDGSGNSMNIKFKSSVNAADYYNNFYLKPTDFGANFLAGYEMSNRISLQLNAQLGLTNINPKVNGVTSQPSSIKNTGFGISLGYRFE